MQDDTQRVLQEWSPLKAAATTAAMRASSLSDTRSDASTVSCVHISYGSRSSADEEGLISIEESDAEDTSLPFLAQMRVKDEEYPTNLTRSYRRLDFPGGETSEKDSEDKRLEAAQRMVHQWQGGVVDDTSLPSLWRVLEEQRAMNSAARRSSLPTVLNVTPVESPMGRMKATTRTSTTPRVVPVVKSNKLPASNLHDTEAAELDDKAHRSHQFQSPMASSASVKSAGTLSAAGTPISSNFRRHSDTSFIPMITGKQARKLTLLSDVEEMIHIEEKILGVQEPKPDQTPIRCPVATVDPKKRVFC